jgi:hypothetical protein
MISKEAAQQALEAIEKVLESGQAAPLWYDAARSISAAIADMELLEPFSRAEILRMALEAGGDQSEGGYAHWDEDWFVMPSDALVKFAALVAASEREACAKVCLGEASANAIRERGSK